MTTPTTEAVIAGSKAFTLALLAPLTERVGTPPRVATDAAQGIALCPGGGLLVVELQGESSLKAIQDLVLEGTDLNVIAAVPHAHAGVEKALRALGIDLARWDGNPEGVLAAVGRRLAAAGVAPARAVAAPVGAFAASAPASDDGDPEMEAALARLEPLSAGGGFFDGVAEADDELKVDVAEEPLPAEPFSGAWPANVPGATAAADALGRGLAGRFDPPGTPFAGIAALIAGFSDLERAVFAGEPQPIETEPIRRAAVTRVRVAAALATMPAEGNGIDSGAVSALLAEIDQVLSDVSTVAQGAPPELQPGLEQVRNALVKEAIDFSEAAHRIAPSESIPAAAPAPRSGKAAQTRIVAIATKAEQEVEQAEARHHRRLFVVLGVAFAIAAGFHGWRYLKASSRVDDRPRRSSAPADAVVFDGARGAPVMVRSKGGRAFTAEELTKLAADEELKGNTVRRTAPNVVVIFPPGVPAPPPSTDAPP
jgi:hypothetical protein